MTEVALIERVRQLTRVEAEAASLREELKQQKELYNDLKKKNDAAKAAVTEKFVAMERMVKQLIEDRNRLANNTTKLEAELQRLRRREGVEIATQSDSEPVTTAVLAVRDADAPVVEMKDAAVDATQSKGFLAEDGESVFTFSLPHPDPLDLGRHRYTSRPDYNGLLTPNTTEESETHIESMFLYPNRVSVKVLKSCIPLLFQLLTHRQLSETFSIAPRVTKGDSEWPRHVALCSLHRGWWEYVSIVNAPSLSSSTQFPQAGQHGLSERIGDLAALLEALQQVRADTLGLPSLIHLVTGFSPQGPLSWSEVEIQSLVSDVRAKKAFLVVEREMPKSEFVSVAPCGAERYIIVMDVAVLGSEVLFLVMTSSGRYPHHEVSDDRLRTRSSSSQSLTSTQWVQLDWLLLAGRSIYVYSASAMGPEEARVVVRLKNDGFLDIGLRIEGMDPYGASSSSPQDPGTLGASPVVSEFYPLRTTEDVNGPVVAPLGIAFVPCGKANRVMCPSKCFPSSPDRVVGGHSEGEPGVLVIRRPWNAAPSVLQFLTAPTIHPMDGTVTYHPVTLPLQWNTATLVTSTVYFGELPQSTSERVSKSKFTNRTDALSDLSLLHAVQKVFSPARKGSPTPAAEHEAEKSIFVTMTRDVGVNTNQTMPFRIGENERFDSQCEVLSEMQLLQEEFAVLELASLSRYSSWLNGQADLLQQRFVRFVEITSDAFSRALWNGAFSPLSNWMRASSDLMLHHSDRLLLTLLSSSSALYLRTIRHVKGVHVAANRFVRWSLECSDLFRDDVSEKVRYYAEDSPKMALSTAAADFMFPGEVELVHHVYSLSNITDDRMNDVFLHCRSILDMILQTNMSFVHSVITAIDERDERIERLELKLVKPPTAEVAVSARTNAGDVALWNTERLRLVLKLSTLQGYFPDVVRERNDLLVEKRRLDTEVSSVHFHVETLNDRCDALGQECDSLTERLQAAADREQGLAVRLSAAQDKIDSLMNDLHQSQSEVARLELQKFATLHSMQDELTEKRKRVSELETEVELLRETVETEPSTPSHSELRLTNQSFGFGLGQASSSTTSLGQTGNPVNAKGTAGSAPIIHYAQSNAERQRPWAENAKPVNPKKSSPARKNPPGSSVGPTPQPTSSVPQVASAPVLVPIPAAGVGGSTGPPVAQPGLVRSTGSLRNLKKQPIGHSGFDRPIESKNSTRPPSPERSEVPPPQSATWVPAISITTSSPAVASLAPTQSRQGTGNRHGELLSIPTVR